MSLPQEDREMKICRIKVGVKEVKMISRMTMMTKMKTTMTKMRKV
jgi:hypothetical protein